MSYPSSLLTINRCLADAQVELIKHIQDRRGYLIEQSVNGCIDTHSYHSELERLQGALEIYGFPISSSSVLHEGLDFQSQYISSEQCDVLIQKLIKEVQALTTINDDITNHE